MSLESNSFASIAICAFSLTLFFFFFFGRQWVHYD